jgi:hypothetical protein
MALAKKNYYAFEICTRENGPIWSLVGNETTVGLRDVTHRCPAGGAVLGRHRARM